MNNITYNFDLFDDLLNGGLNPLNLDDEKLFVFEEELKEHNPKVLNLKIGYFTKKQHVFSITKIEEVSTLHPFSAEYFNNSNQLFCNVMSNFSMKEIINLIDPKIKENQIVYTLKLNKNSLGIAYYIDIHEFSESRLKYCYYYQMLKKEVVEIKRSLKQNLFPLDDSKIHQFVKRTQFLLLNFAIEILQRFKLTEENTKFHLKSEYSNEDYMSIVYLHIIELINYLEVNFKHYMDADLQVPFHSGILKKYRFNDKAKIILNELKKINLNKELQEIITSLLNKVLSLCFENRVTYHELKYFNYFLTTFEYNIVRDYLTEDHVIRLLFELDFNNFELSEYITSILTNELANVESHQEKEVYLLEKKKCISQIIVKSNGSYIKRLPALKESVLQWIEGEQLFLNTLSKHEKDINLVENNFVNPEQKIPINLSTAQLSLCLKLLADKKVIDKISFSELTKWAASNFSTPQTDTISSKSLYNKAFDVKTKTIDEVKTILIQMINQLNNS